MTRRDAALTALQRYRDHAVRRGEAAACLLERARQIEAMQGHERRRSELVDRAIADSGLEWKDAEGIYDLATDEGLDPALAFELLHCRVLVHAPDDALPAEIRGDTILEATPPEWIGGRPPAKRDARRERRLRASFRRLRRLLEERGSPEDALVAFTEEPDVERHAD